VKAALYVLAGIVAALGLGGAGILSVELAKWLFGPVWGLGVWGLSLLILGGGYVGWSVYRMRLSATARPGAETVTDSPLRCGPHAASSWSA
jgi:hypothetical protein